jgi:Holliday junction resolvasome RuvABC endonuclease subunit
MTKEAKQLTSEEFEAEAEACSKALAEALDGKSAAVCCAALSSVIPAVFECASNPETIKVFVVSMLGEAREQVIKKLLERAITNALEKTNSEQDDAIRLAGTHTHTAPGIH